MGSEVQILPGPPKLLKPLPGLAFVFGRTRWIGGGVAQLGEHLLCKQGVIGSNPFTSIPLGSSRIWFDTEGVSSQRRFGIRSVQGSPPIGGFSALADDVGRSLVDVAWRLFFQL